MGASAWSWRSGKPWTSVIFLPVVPWVLRTEPRSPGSVRDKHFYQLNRHDSPRDSRHSPAHVTAHVPAHGSSFPTFSQMRVVNFFLMTAILTGVTQTFRTVLRCTSLANEEVEWFLTYLGAVSILQLRRVYATLTLFIARVVWGFFGVLFLAVLYIYIFFWI